MRHGGPDAARTPSQLPLRITWRRESSFERFVPGANSEAVEAVRGMARSGGLTCLYLWGAPGTGKSHLLHAACEAADAAGRRVVYVPLRDHAQGAPDPVAELHSFQLVCLDDAHCIAARPDWEERVFELYQRLRTQRGGLLVAAPCSPARLGLALPDLSSRFAAELVLRLQPLDDGERKEVLRGLARQRGLELRPEVADFILKRHRRDLHALVSLIERLDEAALAAQRALTLPFVRGVMARERPPRPS